MHFSCFACSFLSFSMGCFTFCSQACYNSSTSRFLKKVFRLHYSQPVFPQRLPYFRCRYSLYTTI